MKKAREESENRSYGLAARKPAVPPTVVELAVLSVPISGTPVVVVLR